MKKSDCKKCSGKSYIKAQLNKQLPDLIGKNVTLKENTIGKVIKYDKETGLSTIEVDDFSYVQYDLNQIKEHGIHITYIPSVYNTSKNKSTDS